MAVKPIDKLGRKELVRLLKEEKLKNRELEEKKYDLEEQLYELSGRIEQLEDELEDRELRVSRCGTMAQAALELNGVIEAADSAARQYVANVRFVTEKSREEADIIIAEAKDRSNLMLERTEKFCREKAAQMDERCNEWRKTTAEECRRMLEETETQCREKRGEADKYWAFAAKHAKQSGILKEYMESKK